VTNAGRRARDLAWIAAKLAEWRGDKVEHEVLDGWGLLALQGPEAARVLQGLAPAFDLGRLTFGKSAFVSVGGVELHVARGGYTGEDGFEVRLPLVFGFLLLGPLVLLRLYLIFLVLFRLCLCGFSMDN
jgi:aminomethyltransferase